MTIEINNESGVDVDANALAALSRFVLDELRVHPLAELSVLLVDVDDMASCTSSGWTSRARPTCCRFPMDELRPGTDDREPEPGLLGDVVLCPQVAAEQAAEPGTPPERGAAPALHARHPAPARLRPRRARRGARDVRPAARAARGRGRTRSRRATEHDR